MYKIFLPNTNLKEKVNNMFRKVILLGDKMKLKLVILLVLFIVVYGYYRYSVNQRYILEEKIDFYQNIVNSEIGWIKGLQLTNGSIAYRPKEDGKVRVNPYFSDITARALLRASDGQGYAKEVKKYLDWHFNHLNDPKTDINGIDGTIYDYTAEIKNGIFVSETSTEKYDSIDSYAAMFLDLLWDYYIYTDDKAYLLENYDKILRVINAMNANMNDGLTIAKPDYPVKYLMDNTEVYEGLGCAIGLYNKVFLPDLKKNINKYADAEEIYSRLKKQKDLLYEKIEDEMWNESDGHYEIALGKDGKAIVNFGWDDFYADATSQLFPIIHGVLDEKNDRAIYLYETFGDHYAWQDFEHYTKGNVDFYWGRLAYAASVMKDEDRIKRYMTYYSENIMTEHKNPLYNADAAWVIMACEKTIDLYESKMKWLFPKL